MNLSAPTQITFIISVILAIIGLLPLLGIAIPIGINAAWALVLGYILLALGVLLKNL